MVRATVPAGLCPGDRGRFQTGFQARFRAGDLGPFGAPFLLVSGGLKNGPFGGVRGGGGAQKWVCREGVGRAKMGGAVMPCPRKTRFRPLGGVHGVLYQSWKVFCHSRKNSG